MCGVVGLVSKEPVNQRLYDALLLLQHRGQDAAGIGTLDGLTFHSYKAMGLVRDVFRTRNMRDLTGNIGIGHVRYPTQGCASSNQESQPFYVNAPYGIMFAHNGNLTNAEEVKDNLWNVDRRHINTTSDSEVLLNVLADELSQAVKPGEKFSPEAAFEAVKGVHRRVKGSYAVVALIAGKGLLAFRDPHGIRPLCFGTRVNADGSKDYRVSSESVSMVGLEFLFERVVAPGEAVFISQDGEFSCAQGAEHPTLNPCAFEFVYFARPDSVIDGISVYGARLRLGEYLANEVASHINLSEIDCVMPIPDSSRPAAQQLAQKLNIPYREGFIKNRYIGRSFIQPTQGQREDAVKIKLNVLRENIKGKRVVMIDDSIVRGTTSARIVSLLREAGATEVHMRVSAPPFRHPCFFGTDIDSEENLIACKFHEISEISCQLGVDSLGYLSVKSTHELAKESGFGFCDGCFTGHYPIPTPKQQSKDKFEEKLNQFSSYYQVLD